MDPLQTQNTGAPTAENPQPVTTIPPVESTHSSTGPIVGSVIIVLILILGGLYYYQQQLIKTGQETLPTTESVVNEAATDQAVAKLQQQGTSDGLNEINADIQSTDTSSIDSDTANIKATLTQ